MNPSRNFQCLELIQTTNQTRNVAWSETNQSLKVTEQECLLHNNNME